MPEPFSRPKKLLVPKIVSFDAKRGKVDPRGTKAFVEYGTSVPEEGEALRRIAHVSSHYIKRMLKHTRLVRAMLMNAGIMVEKEIQDLKDGTSLFEREGFGLDSPEGKRLFAKNVWNNVYELEDLVAKMHGLGIAHNHLHLGNFAITEAGHIILIDLGMARFSQIPDKPIKGWAMRKFYGDLRNFSNTLAIVINEATNSMISPKELKETRADIAANVLAKYPKKLQNAIPLDDKFEILKKFEVPR